MAQSHEAMMSSSGLLIALGVAALAGALIGLFGVEPGWWLGAGLCLVGFGLVPGRVGRVSLVLSLVMVLAGWQAVRQGQASERDLRGYVVTERRLVEVTGVVVEEPTLRAESEAALAAFSFRPPRRLGVLEIVTLTVTGEARAVEGRVQLSIEGDERGPTVGTSMMARGWLTAIESPANPGAFDARAMYARRGVFGRLAVAGDEHWDELAQPGWSWRGWRAAANDRLSAGLLAGIDPEREAGAILDAVLLGRRSNLLSSLQEDFRLSGLAHLLAISGTHIAIIAGLAWLAAGLVVAHPGQRRLWVLAVLLMYLVVLPGRPSVVRSGIMAGCLLLAGWSGRRLGAFDALGLAALIVLAWDPGQVMDPGFQMSFAAVAGILVQMRWSSWRAQQRAEIEVHRTPARQLVSWLRAAFAAGLSAWAATLPIAAWHFGLVALAGPVLTLVAGPVLVVMLGAGVVKMLVGLMSVEVSSWMVPLVVWPAEVLRWQAGLGASLSGLSWQGSVDQALGWVVLLLVGVGLFVGWLIMPGRARLGASLTCAGVLVVLGGASLWSAVGRGHESDDLMIRFLAVGHGNAYVVDFPGPGGVWLVDAGGSPGVGERVLLPTLRSLGIDHLETLVITHADLDHYAGVPEVLDGVKVGRVLVSEGFATSLEEAGEGSALAEVGRHLDDSGVEMVTVSAGWEERSSQAVVRVVWPDAGVIGLSDNDSSLVLVIEAHGRRVLLTGDIDQAGVMGVGQRLRDARVDVIDLPHHGSRRPAAMRWLAELRLEIAVQSSGWPRAAGPSPWGAVLPGVRLFETYRDGAVTIRIDTSGEMTAASER
ncbi:MAG: ComEC/Rec2 family competence protein [Phycisphaeraceae bacterium]